MAVGDKVRSGYGSDIKPGNALQLRRIPVGTIIHNVELKVGKGGQIARSAGTYVQLVGRDAGLALLRLSSGEMRNVPQECMATDWCGFKSRITATSTSARLVGTGGLAVARMFAASS